MYGYSNILMTCFILIWTNVLMMIFFSTSVNFAKLSRQTRKRWFFLVREADQVGRPHSSGRCKRYANNRVFKVIRTANYVKSLINLVRKRAGAENMTDDRLVTGRGGGHHQECARLAPKTEPTDERRAGKSHHLGLLIPNRELTGESAVKT